MEKKFNITGLCLPNEHYMADVSNKMTQTLKMIYSGAYFIINRPRQYGKTTTLYTLTDILEKQGDYFVINTSFEGVGDLFFSEEKRFAESFTNLLAREVKLHSQELSAWLKERKDSLNDMDDLSEAITELVEKVGKKCVLMIDEVDKSSNNQLFVSFLAMLRNKYLARTRYKTFHSVVLAGLHDVKSLKLKLRPDEEQKYNSPLNIAAEYTVDMNLLPSEIKPMLEEYANDKKVKMDTQLIAERLFYYTSGYPFLVSKLCKMMDENTAILKNDGEWCEEDIETAVKKLVAETNTNFESLIKNLENNQELYDAVYEVAIESNFVPYSLHSPLISLGILHGFFAAGNGGGRTITQY